MGLSEGKQHDGVSQYVRLASLLRHRIAIGTYPLGGQLPTITHLARELGMAVVSVRQAYGQLIKEGLIEVQRGKGTHVCALPPRVDARVSNVIDHPFKDDDTVRFIVKGISEEVALPPDLAGEFVGSVPYTWIRKVHIQGGVPFCYAEIYIRQGDFLRLPKGLETHRKIMPAILDLLGDACKTIYQRTTVQPADVPLCDTLEIPFASPVARMVRRLTSASGEVLYASEVWYRGDHYLSEVEFSVADLLLHPGLTEARLSLKK